MSPRRSILGWSADAHMREFGDRIRPADAGIRAPCFGSLERIHDLKIVNSSYESKGANSRAPASWTAAALCRSWTGEADRKRQKTGAVQDLAARTQFRSNWKHSIRHTASPFQLVSALSIGLVLGFVASSFAATIVVSNSITSALARANAGDTLLLTGPAIFNEHVVIDKSIRLVGTGSPAIGGQGIGTPLTISAPDVEVRGLVIRHSGRDLTTFDSGIMITASRASVTHCRIESDAFGVYLRGVSHCQIEENEILGSLEFPSAKRGNGVHLWKTKSNHISNNRIHDKRDGLYLSFADDNVIAGNHISENRFGIHCMYSHQNRLLNNILTKNGVGATLMFSRDSEIEGNQVFANRRHGILLKQVDRSRIAGNRITGHNRGFFIQQATENRFEANLIATNDIGLYLSNASEKNVFVRNSFAGNADQVWQPDDEFDRGRLASNAFSEKGTGNFWSDYTGADRNHDGIGDTPYHETDVFGYIVERHPAARVLALSPAVSLLRKGEELMPLLDTPGVTDPAPLMQPPAVVTKTSFRRPIPFPSPWPSPQGEGIVIATVGQSRAANLRRALTGVLPLPRGEGRDEGKLDIRALATSVTASSAEPGNSQ